tara:strand:- start:123 stop:527 length:405 start_codon:yes stop_codon:yes gene_type:complete
MGQAINLGLAHTNTIYGRLKINDKYNSIYETLEGNVMARFKHEAYAYALEKSHTNFKSVYLYNGYTRIAKAHMPNGTKYLELIFYSNSVANEWDRSSEQIDNVHVEIPWLYRDFNKKWHPVATDDLQKRIFSLC